MTKCDQKTSGDNLFKDFYAYKEGASAWGRKIYLLGNEIVFHGEWEILPLGKEKKFSSSWSISSLLFIRKDLLSSASVLTYRLFRTLNPVMQELATLRFLSLAEQCHTQHFYLWCFKSDFDAVKSKFGLLIE